MPVALRSRPPEARKISVPQPGRLPALGCGPALFHQVEQMRQGFLVTLALFRRQLARALVQLRRHFGGFCRGTTERHQHLGELREVHDLAHFPASAATRVMLMMPMRLFGRSGGCVGPVAIFSRTSSPLISLPKVV